MSGVERALSSPNTIDSMPGYVNGSVHAGRSDLSDLDVQKLTKQTWLNAAHDFVIAYLYSKSNGCIDEFYSDATPSDNSPCLPGKVRITQDWYESKTTLTDPIARTLEKIFAGQGGIQLDNAVQQIYRQYVEMQAQAYPAFHEGISAEEAKNRAEFKQEFLTLQAVKENIRDMVVTNLPDVIDKYRRSRSSFPIYAFHSYKYNNLQLTDTLRYGNMGLTTQQAIKQRQIQANQQIIDEVLRMIDTLRVNGTIEIYDPSIRSDSSWSINVGGGQW